MPDGVFKLRTKESPGASELAPGEDAAPRVLLHGVGLQVEQRCDVGDRQDIVARLGVAETEWRQALRASAQAPPDPGFVVRIRDIADAAARKAVALDNLGDEAPGAWWQRQTGLPGGVLSYELRPGANRPGPAELWARFDQAVDELGRAMGEHSVPAEQGSLEAVSLALHDVVDALLEEEGHTWPPSIGDPDDGGDDGAGEADEG